MSVAPAPASLLLRARRSVASALPKPASISAMIGTTWVWKPSIAAGALVLVVLLGLAQGQSFDTLFITGVALEVDGGRCV